MVVVVVYVISECFHFYHHFLYNTFLHLLLLNSQNQLLDAKTASKQATYTICGADQTKGEKQTDLKATKSEKKCPFKMWWMDHMPKVVGYIVTGFSDGKNFYVITFLSHVQIFALDALEGRLDQQVPFTRMDYKNFIVNGSPPADAIPNRPDHDGRGGGGSKKKTGKLLRFFVSAF